MTSQMNTKVRWVRCPRCRQVLPELAEVPVYKCGGCDTILEAKNRKKDSQDTGARVHEADPTQKNDLENVSEDEKATIPSTYQSDSDKISEKGESGKDCKREWLGGGNQSNESPCSDAISCHENASSSPEARAHMEVKEDKFPSEQCDSNEADPTQKNDLENVSEDEKATIPSTYQSDSDKISEKGESGKDCEREWLGGGNQSNESPCSDAISCHENASSSPEARAHMEVKEDKFPSEQCDSNESRDDGREHSGVISVSNETSSSSEFNCHENESSVPGSQTYENESLLLSPRKVAESRYSSENNSDGGTNESENCDLELPLNTSFSKEVSSSDLCTSHEIEDPSQLAGVDREVDENMKSHSIYRSRSEETFLDMMPKDQISAAQSSSTERVSADNLTSPCTESKKEAQNGIISGFQRVSSVDTLENMPRVYSRSDLGVTLRSPTAKNYYAYDAGASSSYETNDQATNRRFHPLKRNSKDADSNSAKRLPKRADFMVNHAMSSESGLQHQPMNSSSILPGKKHPASEESKWHQGEFLEPARYRHPVRSMMRMETNGYQSGLPFYSNGSQAGYRNGSFSSYGQTNLSEMPGNPPEADKLELLRMVYELQDQLKRTQISKGVPHGRFSTRVAKKEEHISSYNDHFAPEREIYPNPNCHRNPGRYSQDVTWFQQGNQVSRMAPLSGHTAHRWHQVNCLCLRCRRQERYYSAQLPHHVVGCNKGRSMADPIQNYYRPYHSASSSPQHYYTPSEFSLWSRDTKSDDQTHNDHEVKKKHPTAKQHFLPIAGGAPIVACYHCSEMLQLPADFLLFKKRCHRLRCNACSRVLKFSLEMKRNLASASRASDCLHGEPVSYSDDYDQSFCRSCSTEGDHFPLILPFETANRISDSKKMSSSSSLESKKEGKKKSSIVEEFPNKYKNHVKSFDAAGPSSEIEELSPSSGLQLHRLMGYPSPSRLIYKYSDYSTVEQD